LGEKSLKPTTRVIRVKKDPTRLKRPREENIEEEGNQGGKRVDIVGEGIF